MLKSFFPEIFLSLCILIQLLFNSKLVNNSKNNYPLLNKELFIQVIFILLCTFIILLNTYVEINTSNSLFLNTRECVLLKLIITITAVISLRTIIDSFSIQHLNFFEFFSIFLFSILSSFLIVNSNDLISFYLSIEMQSLCFYILASFKRNSVFSSEAGIKYFIASSFMSGIFLFGCGLVYFSLGTLGFSNIALITLFEFPKQYDFILNIGIFLITALLLYKIGSVPFHFLYPDVYEGSPLSSTIIFSLLPYFAIYYFFFKWLMALNLLGNNIKPLLFAFGIFSIFIGTVYAIIQKRLKRLIIYSSIAQTGFLISALSVNSTNGFLIVFFYLIIYIITSFLIWSNFSLFLNFKINSNLFEKKNLSPLLISSFINYFKFDKVLSFTFVLIFFSIAGIPPFAGFLAKILVLYELINQNYIYISIFLIIISSFSVFYYIRIIKTTFFEPISSDKRIKEFISINNLEIHYNYINISLGLYFLIFLFFLSEYIILFFQFIIYS